MIDEFFNKHRYTISKLTDQLDIKPDVLFSLSTSIVDTITFEEPTSITAKLVKTSGRDTTELPTVVTVTGSTFSATPATIDWDGKTNLSLKVLINGAYTVIVPIVQKG